MPAAILWSTLIAWLVLVAVAVLEFVQHWRDRQVADRRAVDCQG